jgi:NADH-quinone oxidoreductase subunit C
LEQVEPEAFSQRVATKLGDAASEVGLSHGQVWGKTTRERVVDAARILKEDPELDCDFFNFLSAVDWEEEGIEILVVLYSTKHRNIVGLKVRLGSDGPSMPTLTGLFGGANWHERECAEMFGVTFEGHPNPKNLYLPDDFEGHPLLKSFKLASRTYKSWPGAKDPSEAEGGRS